MKMCSKLIVFVIAIAAASAAVAPDYSKETDFELRSFIHRCSYSAADINTCFVKNANIAIRDLSQGIEDLQIFSLNGFDIGDIFYSLEEDVSFFLDNIKSFPEGLQLEKANLTFDEAGVFTDVVFDYSLTDYHWEGQYKAIGYFNNTKINEKGHFRINFGPFNGNYTAHLKQKEIENEIYLKVRGYEGNKTYDNFDFVPSNVKTSGIPLTSLHFNQLQTPVFNKAIETRLQYMTFAFNQILLEIPQNELFLP